jgi:hypothetical protein
MLLCVSTCVYIAFGMLLRMQFYTCDIERFYDSVFSRMRFVPFGGRGNNLSCLVSSFFCI